MAESQDGAVARTSGSAGTQLRRRAAALAADKKDDSPNSPRAAGAGGSTNTMMRLYTQDDNPGLKVDPVIVLSLAVVFVFSVVSLHLISKFMRYLSK
ncbi:SEC61-beta family protein [Sporobolomyces koalae]|uniref:SEC61-beta family protein n=1 Tax=Sporobolomyces koalae TaxID=500713 RepID=UPI00316C18A7